MEIAIPIRNPHCLPNNAQKLMPMKSTVHRSINAEATVPGLGDLGRIPAELRNAVYDCVLTETDPIDIFPKSRHRSRHPKNPNMNIKVHTGALWKEPGLLKASSVTRREASAFYYMQNDFSIDIEMHELGLLTKWLKTLVERFGPNLFDSLHISIHNPKWPDLHHARPLARLIHAMSFNPVPGLCRRALCPNHTRQSGHSRISVLCLPLSVEERNLDVMLFDVVEIAVDASRKGLSEKTMERVLMSWFANLEKRLPFGRSPGWWQAKAEKLYFAERAGRRIFEVDEPEVEEEK